MNGLSEEMEKAMAWGEAITDEKSGITLHPITLRNYEVYQSCKSALMIRQSTLPASYVSMPYLKAIYAFDSEHGFSLGLMRNILRVLAMALHMPEDSFVVYVEKANPEELADIRCTENENCKIDSSTFNRIRKIICAQNGDELPNESENIELVEAERDIAMLNAAKLDYSFEKLLSSVAYQYKLRPREMMDWTIREFENAKRAIDRDKGYMLCAQAENAGGKWKNGNPCPSWYADKKREGSIALEPLKDLAARLQIKM